MCFIRCREKTSIYSILFTQDWWNSSNFAGYYRTWNVVVHDWLYSYIYKDVYKVCHLVINM